MTMALSTLACSPVASDVTSPVTELHSGDSGSHVLPIGVIELIALGPEFSPLVLVFDNCPRLKRPRTPRSAILSAPAWAP